MGSLFLCLFTAYQSIANCCHSACTVTLFMPMSMYFHSVPVIVRLLFPCPCPVAISISMDCHSVLYVSLPMSLQCHQVHIHVVPFFPWSCIVTLPIPMYCHSVHVSVLYSKLAFKSPEYQC